MAKFQPSTTTSGLQGSSHHVLNDTEYTALHIRNVCKVFFSRLVPGMKIGYIRRMWYTTMLHGKVLARRGAYDGAGAPVRLGRAAVIDVDAGARAGRDPALAGQHGWEVCHGNVLRGKFSLVKVRGPPRGDVWKIRTQYAQKC